jgi:hypothetical protein
MSAMIAGWSVSDGPAPIPFRLAIPQSAPKSLVGGAVALDLTYIQAPMKLP